VPDVTGSLAAEICKFLRDDEAATTDFVEKALLYMENSEGSTTEAQELKRTLIDKARSYLASNTSITERK
jgi:hypothetical protein